MSPVSMARGTRGPRADPRGPAGAPLQSRSSCRAEGRDVALSLSLGEGLAVVSSSGKVQSTELPPAGPPGGDSPERLGVSKKELILPFKTNNGRKKPRVPRPGD